MDADGNRADIVMDPNSTISRMNIGRVYEMYINAASRDTHKYICRLLGIQPFLKQSAAKKHLANIDPNIFSSVWMTLLGYYKITSPNMYNWIMEGKTESPLDYLSFIIEKGIYLYLPTDNQPESTDMVMQIENSVYKPTWGPVTYTGNSGNRVTTKGNVRVASMYFILLEKTGDDWAAVSTCKLSNFGVLSQLTKQDKYSKPSRLQAVRGSGEAEIRIDVSYVGELFTAELIDRNNNPRTHKHMIKNLLSSTTPTNVENLVDRNIIALGGSKPLALAKHMAAVGGFSFEYKKYMPNW